MHPPARCDVKRKAITRNECVFRRISFFQKINGPQPAHQDMGYTPSRWMAIWFCPHVLQPWLKSDNKRMEKMAGGAPQCAVRGVARVCLQLHAFMWDVGVRSWRREHATEVSDPGRGCITVCSWERKYKMNKMNAVGPYHATWQA